MEKTKSLSLAFVLIVTLSLASAITETIYLDDYELEYSYSGAEEDDTFTLTIKINNTGDEKTDVIFELDEEEPFDVDSDSEWIIGTIEKETQVSQSFRIDVDSGTDEGSYDLPFTLEDSKDDYSEELEISVNSNLADLIIGDINSLPSQIIADQKDIKLEVTIENIGGGDANFVKAKLNLPEGFEKSDSYSDFVDLGSINSGSSKTATFYIDTLKDAPQQNQATITLEYKSDSDKKSEKLSIPLPVRPKPTFEIISSTTSPSTLLASNEGTLKISILNSGEKTGEETSIRIFENTDIPLDFAEKTKYIGDLEKSEQGSAIFPFVVKTTALPSTYLIKIQVRTINSDSVLTEEFNIPITISEEESNPLKTILTSSIIILILLSLILIYVTRK